MIRITLILFTMGVLPTSGEEEFTLPRLIGPPESLTETFFQVPKTGIVNIKGSFLKEMNLQVEEGKSHADLTIIYKNMINEDVSPQYTIRFYNAYGILMGGVRIPYDEKVPELSLKYKVEENKFLNPRITRLDTIFRYSNMKSYPSDFFSVSWISIADSNDKKVERAGAKPSTTQPESESKDIEKCKPVSEDTKQIESSLN